MAIQFTDVPVDGLVPLICKIVVCIDWIAPTHKVVTEVKRAHDGNRPAQGAWR